jgi:hypothetical protein
MLRIDRRIQCIDRSRKRAAERVPYRFENGTAIFRCYITKDLVMRCQRGSHRFRVRVPFSGASLDVRK